MDFFDEVEIYRFSLNLNFEENSSMVLTNKTTDLRLKNIEKYLQEIFKEKDSYYLSIKLLDSVGMDSDKDNNLTVMVEITKNPLFKKNKTVFERKIFDLVFRIKKEFNQETINLVKDKVGLCSITSENEDVIKKLL